MKLIYLPSNGPEDWRWLLAKPHEHWQPGFSAMALAYAWEEADGWPAEVAAALGTSSQLADLKPLLATPEHEVPLPGGRRASQTDLFVLARSATGPLAAIAVEGKVEEPFGAHTVAEWRRQASPGRVERLAHLCSVLELADDERLAPARYQLVHRTASAVIEARRFGAGDAVMLVHSFSERDTWFDDFEAFARLFGVEVTAGEVRQVATLADGVRLHLGWATGPVPPPPARRVLGERFDRAVALARDLHADQLRKDTDIPYVGHLLAVASLVVEDGGTEDEAVAAVLHDAVEDQGGPPTLARIKQLFGADVAKIVDECSDTDEVPKPPWKARKEAYVEHLRTASEAALRVSLADKVHNARSILYDLRAGHDVFSRFSAERAETLWYYRALAERFAERLPGSPLAAELMRTVEALEHEAAE